MIEDCSKQRAIHGELLHILMPQIGRRQDQTAVLGQNVAVVVQTVLGGFDVQTQVAQGL